MATGFVPALVLSALILKLIDWLKALTNGEWRVALTQVIVWAAAIAALFIAGATQFAHTVGIGGVSLHALGGWDKVFVGLGLGSTGSFAFDTLASLNKTNTNALRRMKLPSVSVSVTPQHAQKDDAA